MGKGKEHAWKNKGVEKGMGMVQRKSESESKSESERTVLGPS